MHMINVIKLNNWCMYNAIINSQVCIVRCIIFWVGQLTTHLKRISDRAKSLLIRQNSVAFTRQILIQLPVQVAMIFVQESVEKFGAICPLIRGAPVMMGVGPIAMWEGGVVNNIICV